MKKRQKISKQKSKKLFRNTAQKVNNRNQQATPMRGGIRL